MIVEIPEDRARPIAVVVVAPGPVDLLLDDEADRLSELIENLLDSYRLDHAAVYHAHRPDQ